MSVIPLDEQLAEVAREIEMRRRVYPAQVARQKMSQPEADRQMEIMRAVQRSLLWFKRNEDQLRKLAPKLLPENVDANS